MEEVCFIKMGIIYLFAVKLLKMRLLWKVHDAQTYTKHIPNIYLNIYLDFTELFEFR